MIIQDSQIIPNSLTEIFKNPEQRKRILKILIQTLYNLGYQQSAAQLQSQSKITYLTPQIKIIKNALPQQNYEEIQKILKNNSKFVYVKDILYQLKCYKMIRQGKMEQALYVIQNQIKEEKKKQELSEQLMMGTGHLSPQILRKKHNYILQTCFDSDISPNSMFKMINCYIQLQKRGLTTGISPQFSLLKKPTTLRRPPMRVVQTATSVHLKNICFIKFNRNASKILIISAHKKQKYASIWGLNKQKAMISQLKNCAFTIDEEIVNVSWNYQHNQLIAIATTSHICIFNSDFSTKCKKKLPSGLHNINRILCLNWNPMTNFLYVGGAFDNIKIYGSTLQQIMTIQPFMRTRNLYFNNQGTHMYAISATKGLFTYHNLYQNKQQAHFNTQDAITSFRLQNHDKNIVLVTQTKIIYMSVQDQNKGFTIIHSFPNNFSQNGLVQIQACLFYPWIVSLGQKQFQAYSLQKQKDLTKQQRWNSKNSFTFDIVDNFMISGSKQLYLWSSQLFQDNAIQSQNQSDMQIQQTNKNENGQSRNQNNNSQNMQQEENSSDDHQEQEQEEHQQSEEIDVSEMEEF